MTSLPAPSLAALRAVHQYRRRDVMPYLALRYYLDNAAARSERWSTELASELTFRRESPNYLTVHNFKGRNATGHVEHRVLQLPAPSEALAETALLANCSASARMTNPSCVFSYGLVQGLDPTSSFEPYMGCIRRRHEAIASACAAFPTGEVQYLDIRRFYPSIQIADARHVWRQHSVDLHSRDQTVGESILEHHATANDGRLLTGPMFSHLIGNLLLRSMDEKMSAASGLCYFRYVDDIVLVGSQKSVREGGAMIENHLGEFGLHVHDERSDKWLNISASNWLEGKDDFAEEEYPISWKTLIGGLKWLLVEKAADHDLVRRAFIDEEFRLPMLDYQAAVLEQPYLTRLVGMVRRRWYWRCKRTLEELLREALVLRERYVGQLEHVLTDLGQARDYGRKRLIPKARYLCGRVMYLATHYQLAILAERLRAIPELEFHATTLKAVAEADVTEPLRLGADVVQAVAQPLRTERRTATVQGPVETQEQLHGLAVLAMNGVAVTGQGLLRPEQNELLEISERVSLNHLRSVNSFVRTFASLHGVSNQPRHPQMLDSAFHESDSITFDAVSSYMHDS